MGKAIRYGIDLGTTNSAIAVNSDDSEDIKIIKNRDQMEVTASAIRIEKNKSIHVGRRAYETNISDSENVAVEFKRWLGKKEKKGFKASGVVMDAEELSAEVLKSLLADAAKMAEDKIRSAVITVPAAFGNLQCEATARAASLAGLEEAPLLPEPIAAAVAYGMDRSNLDQNWLVYDWGGGTFDTAVISTREGRLQVLSHHGDNALGGKDIDNIIIEEVLRPKLKRKYDLPTVSENPSAYYRLQQYLKGKAEEIKKELSFSDSMPVLISNDAGEDNRGEPLELEFSFARSEFENMISGLVAKTIALCKKSLEEARLLPDQLSKIILVGGSTFIPLVRQSLTNSFSIKLEYSHDPITVVAMGAALHAATTPSELTGARDKAVSLEELRFNLSYPLTSSEERCPVAGKCEDLLGIEGLEIKVEAEGNYWNSGWLEAPEGFFELEVALLEGKACRFWIYARDKQGRLHDVEPESFKIIQRPVETADPPLSYSLGLEVKEGGVTVIEKIFKRSTPIPAEGLEWDGAYLTTRDLLPTQEGPDDYIALKLFEGESERPGENNFAGAIIIRPHHLERPLYKGSEIELHVKVDQSRLIRAWAHAPGHELNYYELYERSLGEDSFEGEIRKQVDQVYDIIYSLKSRLPGGGDLDLASDLYDLQQEVDQLVEKAGDLSSAEHSMGDQREQTYRGLAGVKKRLSLISSKARQEEYADSGQTVEERLLVSLDDELESLNRLIELPDATITEQQKKEATAVSQKAEELREKAPEELNRHKIDSLTQHLSDLTRRILLRQPWWWKEHLDHLSSPEHNFKDSAVAKKYLKKGKSALSEDNLEELKESVLYLWKLLPEPEVVRVQKELLETRIKKKM